MGMGMGMGGMGMAGMMAGAMGGMGGIGGMAGGVPTFMPQAGAASVSVTVAVPDEHIGAVLGKGGRTISEIQVVSGVRIKVSDRNDFVEGTRNRKVILTGSAEGVQIAQYLLAQKLRTSTVPGS